MSDSNFFDSLVSSFELLPGVGNKTAKRYAYHVIEKMTDDEVKEFCNSLLKTKENVCNCSICGMLSLTEPCPICSNKSKDHSKVMVLKDTKDILAIDGMGVYEGLYHSLNGLISLSNGVGPREINIDSLLRRLDGSVLEVILAMPFTQDGETTSLYLEKILANYNVEVSRLGFGLPAGGDIEYVDELTLKRAFEYRIKK